MCPLPWLWRKEFPRPMRGQELGLKKEEDKGRFSERKKERKRQRQSRREEL